jgi:3-hydroxybutyryl-CoA dehydratase
VTAPGDAIGPAWIRVRADSMPIWARALRDPNPIHTDAAAARAAGLGDRVINQGPANIGYLVNALSAHFPDGAIERMDFRFIDNVRDGDVAVAGGTVRAVEALACGARVECEMVLTVDGRAVLTGTATLVTET